MTQKQTTLKELLPSDLGNRETVRNNSSRAEDIVRIEISKIVIRPGFNVRTDYGDIEGLALSILHNGQTDPGRVDVLENGTFMLVDGHRRFEALKLLAKQGHEGLFRAFVNNSVSTVSQLRKVIPSQTERSAAVKEAVANSGGKKVKIESIIDTKGQKAESIVAAIEKHVGHDLFGDLRQGVVATVKNNL